MQVNLLADLTADGQTVKTLYNIGVRQRMTLLELYGMIRDRLMPCHPELLGMEPQSGFFRPGDIRHSLADIAKARRLLGSAPSHTVAQGLDTAVPWFVAN